MHRLFAFLALLASSFALPVPYAPQNARSLALETAPLIDPVPVLEKRQDDEDIELGGTPFPPRQVDPGLEYGGTPFDKRQEKGDSEDLELGATPFSRRQVDPDLEYGGTPFDKRDGGDDDDLEKGGSPFEDITSRNIEAARGRG